MTPTFHIAVLRSPLGLSEAELEAIPADLDDSVLAKAVRLENEVWTKIMGHADFTTTPKNALVSMRDQKRERKVKLVALAGDPIWPLGELGLPEALPETVTEREVLGLVGLENSLTDNTHVVDELEVTVHPDARRIGIADALLDRADDIARQWGATTISGWGHHPNTEADPATAIRASEGPFMVDPSEPTTQLALKHGYSLAMLERHSALYIDPDAAFTQLADVPVHPDYELLVWQGRTPEELRDGMVTLKSAMSADIPKGDLDFEAVTWDVDRLMDRETQSLRTYELLTAVARHKQTGELAAETQVFRDHDNPEGGQQGDTLVLQSHRGHGLGLSIKLANLAQAREKWPKLRRILTWNAGHNDWMWRINQELGFETHSLSSGWQKKLN